MAAWWTRSGYDDDPAYRDQDDQEDPNAWAHEDDSDIPSGEHTDEPRSDVYGRRG